MGSKAPLLTKDGDLWFAHQDAGGPFGGLHGGAVTALLMLAMQQTAPEPKDDWQGLSFQAQFLRPVPRENLTASAELVRQGGRTLAMTAELQAEGKLLATARAAFGKTRQIEALVPPPLWDKAVNPLEFPESPFRPPMVEGRRWFGDACDFRRGPDGCLWIRPRNPLVSEGLPSLHPLGYVSCLADWASGPFKPDGFVDPAVAAFPNVDLSVHLTRPPRFSAEDGQGWVGLLAEAPWQPNGLGTTFTKIFDRQGFLGQACQSCILTPADA
ncbi:thioesterase family protein [Rhodovibrionaceae bacterium A322]